MDELKNTPDWRTDAAVRRLSPEVRAAAARIKKKRDERKQLIAFLAVLTGLVGLIAYAAIDFSINGELTRATRNALIALGCAAGLCALFSPILAYFAEEDTSYESI